MKLDACSILINVRKCPTKSKRRLACALASLLRLGFASYGSTSEGTILSLFLAKSVGKVNEKGQGTLVTLLEVGMLRIE